MKKHNDEFELSEAEKYVQKKASIPETGFTKNIILWLKIWYFCHLGGTYHRIRKKLEKNKRVFIYWKGIKYEIVKKIDLTKHTSNEERDKYE